MESVKVTDIAIRRILPSDGLDATPLQKLIGIELPEQIPQSWSVSRFREALGQDPHRSPLQEIFDVMAEPWASSAIDRRKVEGHRDLSGQPFPVRL